MHEGIILSQAEASRYSRHLSLPEVGYEGQRRLRTGAVLIVGVGGLGSSAALHLAAAGVGRIGLVDFDTVEVSNLQRQVLYNTQDEGRPKVEAAAERLQALNPFVKLGSQLRELTEENVNELIDGYDLIIDGTDTFKTRYVINQACATKQVPNVSASINQFSGHVSVYSARGGPCYQCLFRAPPALEEAPTCGDAGVLGAVPGLIGLIQATEALKLLLGIGDSLIGKLLTVDALRMAFHVLSFDRDPYCPACGTHSTLSTKGPAASATKQEGSSIGPQELSKILSDGSGPFLLDVREPHEHAQYNIGGTLIPLTQLPVRIDELAAFKGKPLVVYCRSGMRSAQAVAFLRHQGFPLAVNLRGGLQAWKDAGISSAPEH